MIELLMVFGELKNHKTDFCFRLVETRGFNVSIKLQRRPMFETSIKPVLCYMQRLPCIKFHRCPGAFQRRM